MVRASLLQLVLIHSMGDEEGEGEGEWYYRILIDLHMERGRCTQVKACGNNY